ncbi:16S rRNA (guanine(527)-N(7))-methyltransferase RsmG [Desulfobacterota bacterium AH_259_B03_O07]|nr:16S rRNA (guanine(527)-N(7))-methyltransferase RsmG [Desulfobacterota bacterium AH_259_B03_O07]
MNTKELLIKGAKQLNVALSSEQLDLFLVYLRNLQLWNKKISLTSISENSEIVISHFVDSLSIVQFINDGSKLLDIGSGAGFPGIPLKIVRPSIEMTLIDSVQKRVYFLSDTIRKLKLEQINVICGRAESPDNGVQKRYFDFVVTRAVGKIDYLIEISFPYLMEEGKIILMRGKKGLEEWSQVSYKNPQGLRLLKFDKFYLPFGNQQRIILVLGR